MVPRPGILPGHIPLCGPRYLRVPRLVHLPRLAIASTAVARVIGTAVARVIGTAVARVIRAAYVLVGPRTSLSGRARPAISPS